MPSTYTTLEPSLLYLTHNHQAHNVLPPPYSDVALPPSADHAAPSPLSSPVQQSGMFRGSPLQLDHLLCEQTYLPCGQSCPLRQTTLQGRYSSLAPPWTSEPPCSSPCEPPCPEGYSFLPESAFNNWDSPGHMHGGRNCLHS